MAEAENRIHSPVDAESTVGAHGKERRAYPATVVETVGAATGTADDVAPLPGVAERGRPRSRRGNHQLARSQRRPNGRSACGVLAAHPVTSDPLLRGGAGKIARLHYRAVGQHFGHHGKEAS